MPLVNFFSWLLGWSSAENPIVFHVEAGQVWQAGVVTGEVYAD